MAVKPLFRPTADNTYIIEYPSQEGRDPDHDFAGILLRSRQRQAEGDIEGACNMRFEAFQRLADMFPEGEEMILDWEEEQNRGVMELIHASAIDHFLGGDMEMTAAMLEMLLDLDPEDHLEATIPLAYSYIALNEHELFDEIINDISDKYPEKEIIKLWSEFMRTGDIPAGELTYMKKSLPHLYHEFTATEHPLGEEYLRDIDSERPSKKAQARELWLQTEHLWLQYPQFIEALKKS